MRKAARAVWAIGVGAWLAALVVACGGPGSEAKSAESGRDEERAGSLLARARESHDVEKYRRLVSRFPDTPAAGEGRDELAGLLVEEAKKSLAGGDFSTANERLEEAALYAGLALTEQARAVQKQVDEGRAARVTKKAEQAANEGKCASALKLVAAPLREKARDHFKKELRQRSEKALVLCVSQKVVENVKENDVDGARALVASPDTTTALSKEAFAEVQSALRKALVGRSTVAVEPLLRDKKWAEAFAKLQELKTAGTLSEDEHPVAVQLVRDAIRAEVTALVKSAGGATKAASLLQSVDAAIAAAGWSGEPPEEVQSARKRLTIVVEAERMRCKVDKTAPAWAWGSVELLPPESAAGAATGKLPHGSKVWTLCTAGAKSLVARADPGAATGAAALEKASGWVDAKLLKNQDTESWLPPNEQLVGVAVWAPLRPPAKDYHLGTVKKVEGRKVTVERMADKSEQVVELGALRAGKLPSGLKVMAFCVGQVHTEPAKVDSVVSTDSGVPRVKIVCDKGDITRVEIGSALVTKAEWLPARKP